MGESPIFLTTVFYAFLVLLSTSKGTTVNWNGQNLRFLENYAPDTGNIPLILGDEGFYAHVDFVNHQNEASESATDNDSDYGDMLIALYTDQTFFGQVCQGFEDYCQKYGDICSKVVGNETNLTFPYFQSPCKPIRPQIFLDYNYWYLDSTAFVSTQCGATSGGQEDTDAGGYGMLGMGISDLSAINFKKKSTFSIQIAKNLSQGTFAFDVDLTQAKSSTPAATIPSDNLWHISNIESITVGGVTINVNASMIFDLGTDSIGLPAAIHSQVINQISTHPSIGGCSIADDFQPICNYTGDIRRLPTVLINIGSEQVEIPPEVYVVQTQDNYFYYDPITLKFKILSNNLSEGSYVTPKYQNYIILGYPAMSYYYATFESDHLGQASTITLYYSKEFMSASDYTWLFVLGGVLGLIIVGLIFFVYQRKQKKKVVTEEEASLMSQEPVKPKLIRRRR